MGLAGVAGELQIVSFGVMCQESASSKAIEADGSAEGVRVSAVQDVQPGMPVYSSDGQMVGTVEAVSDEGITVNGAQILAAMVTGVSGGRVDVNYTTAQMAWQTSTPDEKDDAVSWDASNEGELVERMERGELAPAPEFLDEGRRSG